MNTTNHQGLAVAASGPCVPMLRWLGLPAAIGVYLIMAAQPWVGSLLIAPWDKLAHFTLYGALTAWLSTRRQGHSLMTVFLCVALIGLSDEVFQAFLPARSADVFDWFADIAAAAGVCLVARRYRLTHPQQEEI